MHPATPTVPNNAPIGARPPGDRLSIAFIVPEDRQTGTYFRFHNLAIALRKIGQEVTVYSQTNENRFGVTHATRDGVPYLFCPTVRGNRFVISPVNPGNIARRLLFPIPVADVYHLFQPYPSGAIPWLALRARRNAVFAYDWDDYWMNDEFGLKQPANLNARVTSLWVRLLEQHLPQQCDLLTTLSHAIAGLGHRWRTPRCEIVYNGVWDEPLVERSAARRALGLHPDAFYAAMMGWSGEVEWALSGLRSQAARHPRLRLAWCGQDPSAALEQFPDLRTRIDVLGFLRDERLRQFRCAVDLGLIPMADTEFNRFRLPYKLTDFLAAGTPVLTSDVGEASVVARRLPGTVTCAPTREAWIAEFGRAVDARMGEGVPGRVDRTRLLEEFEWTRIAVRLLSAYRAVQRSTALAA